MYIGCLVIIDQMTKYLALLHWDGFRIKINRFMDIYVVINKGFVWGFFDKIDKTVAIFYSFTMCFLGLIYLSFEYRRTTSRWTKFFIKLLCAGIIGNFVDRVIYGGVVDFMVINLPIVFKQVFNLSDVFISIGLGGFIWLKFFYFQRGKRGKKPFVREIKVK